ncbi:hypothetical protein [Butyrivibrio sp. MC2013]|uniref:hypothetical protein n=1 Tax=Butyrivibrio sp. MC2013 TaxID=1280686 RepID=UPI000479C96E|nr:hypothetical protein [Butyrivibrio sp. MC2013]
MKKRLKSLCMALLCSITISLFCAPVANVASAITLKQSWQNGAKWTSKHHAILRATTYKKTAYSQTRGYKNKKKRHWVKAQMGKKDEGIFVQSNKVYGNGDITATVSYELLLMDELAHTSKDYKAYQKYFPTCHNSYGW